MTEPAHNTTRIDLTFALGALAGVLLAQRDRKRVGSLAGLIGLGLIGAAVQPVIRNWVVRHGAARRRVRLRTTIQVARAVPDVFASARISRTSRESSAPCAASPTFRMVAPTGKPIRPRVR